MGGDSSQTTNTSQSFSNQTNPWAPAQPFLNGILGQLKTGLSNTGITPNETNALNNYQGMVPQFLNYAQSLSNGGGALGQAGNINQGYQDYLKNTSGLASNTNYDPYSTPGFADAMRTMASDISNNVRGQFAAGGRDFSGMEGQTIARGISQGIAPAIAAQYNQNVSNQQGAAGNLYNAGNTTGGLLSNLQQQYLQNQGQGFTTSGDILGNSLNAEAARRGIPVQSLGLLANIGIPIAGLGGTSSGTSNGTSTSTYSPSFWQTAGSLMPKGPMTFNF